ncbi:unnamed protein product [Amoebophrya sp. A25]|nr:unnamed protein product [Amoebophrya sp. A25]|eukprot:GSA25T00013530001.1
MHVLLEGLDRHKVLGDTEDSMSTLSRAWHAVKWSQCASLPLLERAVTYLHSVYPVGDYSFVSVEWDDLFRALNWHLLSRSPGLFLNRGSSLLLKLELVGNARGRLELLRHFVETVLDQSDAAIDLLQKAWPLLPWLAETEKQKIMVGKGVKEDLSVELYGFASQFLETHADCSWAKDLLPHCDLSLVSPSLLLSESLVPLEVLLSKATDLGRDVLQETLLRRMLNKGSLCEKSFASPEAEWHEASDPNLRMAFDLLLAERSGTAEGRYPEGPSSEATSVDVGGDRVTRIATNLALERLPLDILRQPRLPIYALLQSRLTREAFEACSVPLFFYHCETYEEPLREDSRRIENLLHCLFDSYKAILARSNVLRRRTASRGMKTLAVVSGAPAGRKYGGAEATPAGSMVGAEAEESRTATVPDDDVLGTDELPADGVLPFSRENTARIFTLLDECDCTRQQILPLLDCLDLCYLPRSLYNVEWVDSCVLLECKLESTERKLEQRIREATSHILDRVHFMSTSGGAGVTCGAPAEAVAQSSVVGNHHGGDRIQQGPLRCNTDTLSVGAVLGGDTRLFASDNMVVVNSVSRANEGPPEAAEASGVRPKERAHRQPKNDASGVVGGGAATSASSSSSRGGAMDAIVNMTVMQTREEVAALRAELRDFQEAQRRLLQVTLPSVLESVLLRSGVAASPVDTVSANKDDLTKHAAPFFSSSGSCASSSSSAAKRPPAQEGVDPHFSERASINQDPLDGPHEYADKPGGVLAKADRLSDILVGPGNVSASVSSVGPQKDSSSSSASGTNRESDATASYHPPLRAYPGTRFGDEDSGSGTVLEETGRRRAGNGADRTRCASTGSVVPSPNALHAFRVPQLVGGTVPLTPGASVALAEDTGPASSSRLRSHSLLQVGASSSGDVLQSHQFQPGTSSSSSTSSTAAAGGGALPYMMQDSATGSCSSFNLPQSHSAPNGGGIFHGATSRAVPAMSNIEHHSVFGGIPPSLQMQHENYVGANNYNDSNMNKYQQQQQQSLLQQSSVSQGQVEGFGHGNNRGFQPHSASNNWTNYPGGPAEAGMFAPWGLSGGFSQPSMGTVWRQSQFPGDAQRPPAQEGTISGMDAQHQPLSDPRGQHEFPSTSNKYNEQHQQPERKNCEEQLDALNERVRGQGILAHSSQYAAAQAPQRQGEVLHSSSGQDTLSGPGHGAPGMTMGDVYEEQSSNATSKSAMKTNTKASKDATDAGGQILFGQLALSAEEAGCNSVNEDGSSSGPGRKRPVYWGRIAEEVPDDVKEFLPTVQAFKPKILIRKNKK